MSNNPWKVISSTTVHETPWIEIKADTCQTDDRTLTYTYTKRKDEGPVIIAEDNDKLWLVQQYRHPAKKFFWQFPVEGKQPTETWEAAAHRGLAEELQRKTDSLVYLGTLYPDPGGLEQKSKIFVAHATSALDEKAKHDEDEVEELIAQAFTLAEIKSMVATGEICDGWTLSSLYLYEQNKGR